MRNLFIFVFIIGLFLGCGKYEPKLPQNYENVSFVELMSLLEAKEESPGRYSLYLSDSDNKHINSSIHQLCKAKKGDIKEDGVGEYIGFRYCNLENEILFGYWIYFTYDNKDSRYKYWFNNNSKDLKKEFDEAKAKVKAKEVKLLELKNKRQLIINKILKDRELVISKKIKEIRENAKYNSERVNYLNKNFKSINDIYYFNVYAIVENKFIIDYEKNSKLAEFTDEALNSITDRYILNVTNEYDIKENILGNTEFMNEFQNSKTINLSKRLIIGVKNLKKPYVYKECSKNSDYDFFTKVGNEFKIDKGFSELFKNNEAQIRQYKSVYCIKDYEVNVSLDEILIFEKNQLVSYAFINDSDELKKLKIEENKIKYTD
ncbi:hypothetical protein [Aliarcobacter butzleri]|uniref:hypothetical protein n=1 Tax=Aliarcobacter butzleri TaxID=28197 RepID=UPI0021B3624B|nr:hypothetical protein [Aliarcobacter butzleri]MCT7556134.1 hypothetical protein [Aliarcobacter butzleri]